MIADYFDVRHDDTDNDHYMPIVRSCDYACDFCKNKEDLQKRYREAQEQIYRDEVSYSYTVAMMSY